GVVEGPVGHGPAVTVERAMQLPQHVGVDEEAGGEVDRAAHAGRDVVGEEAAHLGAKRQVFGMEQEIHGASLPACCGADDRRVNPAALERDDISYRRRPAPAYCRSTIASEIRVGGPRGGRRRSWIQARYSVFFARCPDGANRLQVDASSLLSAAPQRNSTQSLRLYAISSACARSTTSLTASVQGEPSLRVYENLRAASSDASTLSSSAFTAATLLSSGMA